MTGLELIFIILGFILVIQFPPLGALIFMLFSSSELCSLGSYLLEFTPQTSKILGATCLMGGLFSLLRLKKECLVHPDRRRLIVIAYVTIGIIIWGIISMTFNGESLTRVILDFRNVEILGVIYALAYRNDRGARMLFVGFVSVHILIGTLITSWPTGPLEFLRSEHWMNNYGVDFASRSSFDLYRDPGQFSNPIRLGFLAGVGIIVGCYLHLSVTQNRKKHLGQLMVLMSLWLQYITFTRGIWLGLMFGFAVVAVRPLRLFRGIAARIILLVLVICGGWLFLSNVEPPTGSGRIGLLLEIWTTEVSDRYRIKAITSSLEIINTRPLVGCGDYGKTSDKLGYMPHQAPLYYSVLYGLPAGFFVAVLLWWGIKEEFSRRGGNFGRYSSGGQRQIVNRISERDVATLFGWLVFFLAMTNGFAGGMIQWIILGAVCAERAKGASVPAPQGRAPLGFRKGTKPVNMVGRGGWR